ncbi:zinc finger-containing ubiquitin peptidase 1 [Labrus bergylta]|uniref:zinc finger-containing ubiquitin peptidase 1 n=1 Tax=Labrus bergylta TaxID=56723 RepID=UPI0033135BAB
MLTCDICGEQLLLEDDLKTHLLLSHEENDMRCPLCSLSGVSYDQLRFHVSSAHPEERDPADQSTSKHTGGTHTESCRSRETASFTSTPQRPKTRPESSSHRKAKQKRLSSTTKDDQLQCPLCPLLCSTGAVLQEHVELHLMEQRSPGGKFECPLCSVLCSDSVSLQEHVELHLDQGAAAGSAGSPDSDLKLARRLQDEEEQRRRQQEDWQEKEEFKKLQRQFGVDGSGGYSRQVERTMERAVARGLMAPAEFHSKKAELMESLASGVDDGRTRTQGVIKALYEHYQTDCRDCVHVWLSADTDHFCSSAGDKGWGCGYRNLQMMLSSLHRIDTYTPIMQDRTIPSIPRVQRMIEEAWREGLDAQGASHFDQRLQGTRAWIGATEIYSLLTSLRIKARIVDFHRHTGPADTHPRLFEWVKQYFSQTGSNRLPPRLVQTSLPPLYLQHQGHSRSIVGLEQKKNGSLCLLILDPGSSVSETRKLLRRESVGSALRHVRKSISSLKHRQYQVVALQGVLSAEEKQISILKSRTLCAERIP